MPSQTYQGDNAAGASVRVSTRIAAMSQQQQEEQKEEQEEGPPPSSNKNAATTAPARNDVNAAVEVDEHTPPSDDSSDDFSDDSSEDGFKGKKKEGAEKNYTKKQLYAKLQIERTATTDLWKEIHTIEREKNQVVKVSKKFERKVESLEKTVSKLQKQSESIHNKQSVVAEKAAYIRSAMKSKLMH